MITLPYVWTWFHVVFQAFEDAMQFKQSPQMQDHAASGNPVIVTAPHPDPTSDEHVVSFQVLHHPSDVDALHTSMGELAGQYNGELASTAPPSQDEPQPAPEAPAGDNGTVAANHAP